MGQIPTLLESFNFKRVTLHFLCLIHSEIGLKSKTFALDKNTVFFLSSGRKTNFYSLILDNSHYLEV